MKDEIDAAVKFLIKLIKQNSKIKEQDLLNFQQYLRLFLMQKFHNHWHPDRPWQGQGYRCLRVNGTNGKEPTIAKAASECGLVYSDLKLPIELTVWVDPTEVCCRFGEHKGSYCTVASFKDGKKRTYIDEIDLTEIGQGDSINENIKNGNARKSPLSPSFAYRDSSGKENISPVKGGHTTSLTVCQNAPSSSESRNLKSLYDSSSFPNNNNNAPTGFNCNSPFSYEQQRATSVFQHGDSEPGLTLYNRNSLPNGSPYFKPSSWISYPTSISPPQPPLPPNNYFEYSPPPPPFTTSQDNLNFSRVSPVNLNELRWHSAHYTGGANPYARNGWVMHRQLVGV